MSKVLADEVSRKRLDAILTNAKDAALQLLGANGYIVEALRDALLARDELVGHEITDVIAASIYNHEDADVSSLVA